MTAKALVKSVWDFPRSMVTARVLTQLGYDHGLTIDNMLNHTGITREVLNEPAAEIQAHQEVQLIRNLINALPHIPTLGVEAGLRYHINTYGMWSYAVLSSPTLGSGISMASRMLNMTFSLTINEVTQLGDQVISSIHSDHLPPDVHQFILDRDRAAVITLQREILGQPLPYRVVQMRRPEPAAHIVEAYTQLFGIRPQFNQLQDGTLFDSALMHTPLPAAQAQTVDLCIRMCRELVEARQSRTGVAATVRERILSTPGRIPDMETIAGEMNITSRTLRRHLTHEGVTFRMLLEEVLSTLAQSMMAAASLTHGEIAERLGYADVTTFIEAFRRWTGVAPSTYRRSIIIGTSQRTRPVRRRFIPR